MVDTINTSGIAHTSCNLQDIVKKTIEKTEDKFGCIIRSVVTDNAANMLRMGRLLHMENDTILTYGCNAHMLNLFAHDVSKLKNNREVQQNVVKIIKFFRNHHLPKAWYEANGGTALIMPLDVRWNTYSDSLESYIHNWASLAATCEEYRENNAMDADIGKCKPKQSSSNFKFTF